VLLPDGKIRLLIDFSHYGISQEGDGEQRVGLCWDITDFLSFPGEGDAFTPG